MSDLASKRCEPCTAETPRLSDREIEGFLPQLPGWRVSGGTGGDSGAGDSGKGKKLEKEFKFPDFRQALAFVNRVGEVAEKEGHHPDLELGWGRVKIVLWTHAIGGLSESDMILAAKAERALAG